MCGGFFCAASYAAAWAASIASQTALQGQQDRGVAVLVVAGGEQYLVALERGQGTGPPSFSMARRASRAACNSGRVRPMNNLAQHRRRGLAQSAGLHVLGELDDAAVPDYHIGRDRRHRKGASGDARTLRAGQAAEMRDVGGEPEDAGRVELDEVAVAHGNPWLTHYVDPALPDCQGEDHALRSGHTKV